MRGQLYRIQKHGKTITHLEANTARQAEIRYRMHSHDTDEIKVTVAISNTIHIERKRKIHT